MGTDLISSLSESSHDDRPVKAFPSSSMHQHTPKHEAHARAAALVSLSYTFREKSCLSFAHAVHYTYLLPLLLFVLIQKKTSNDAFDLFSESFDTLSHAGRNLSPVADTFSFSESLMSPPPRIVGTCRSMSHHHRPRGDIQLPKLPKDRNDNDDAAAAAADDEYQSLGDISPIKVEFSGHPAARLGTAGSRESERRRLDAAIAPPPTIVAMSHPSGWGWNPPPPYPHAHNVASLPSSVSNPFYVIRSACFPLAGCKYILPCLQGVDLCRVSLSEHYGHVRQYRDPSDEVSQLYSRQMRRTD